MGEIALHGFLIALACGWIIHKAPESKADWGRIHWLAFYLTSVLMAYGCLLFWAWVVVTLGIF